MLAKSRIESSLDPLVGVSPALAAAGHHQPVEQIRLAGLSSWVEAAAVWLGEASSFAGCPAYF